MAVLTQELADRYAVYNGDCIEVLPTLPDRSVHACIHSPPFCGLFHYSSSERDLSNARTYEEFFQHYEYVVREIYRVLLPGRISAVHCMDVPKDGANICGYTDFPGDIIRLHQRLGFEYTPRICIWKEPLEVRNRTMIRSLAHRCIVEDSTQATVAAADYLIPFRKKGKNPIPVSHPVGLLRYAGERQVPPSLLKYRKWKGKQTGNRYSHWIWRNYASSFWDDIRLNRVLPFDKAREAEDERHVHPLQLDVIERAVTLWSNPDEVILTPFMGVGSEVYGALVNGRKGIGIELKPTYYRQALENIHAALEGRIDEDDQPTLYDHLESEASDSGACCPLSGRRGANTPRKHSPASRPPGEPAVAAGAPAHRRPGRAGQVDRGPGQSIVAKGETVKRTRKDPSEKYRDLKRRFKALVMASANLDAQVDALLSRAEQRLYLNREGLRVHREHHLAAVEQIADALGTTIGELRGGSR